MKFLTLGSVLAAAVFSAAVVFPFYPRERSKPAAQFEVVMKSSETGDMQLFPDDGRGFREAISSRQPVFRQSDPQLYQLTLPQGRIRALRFDPINISAQLTITAARITDMSGQLLREIPLTAFRPEFQVTVRPTEGGLEIEVPAGSEDPQLMVILDPPLDLSKGQTSPWVAFGVPFVAVFATCVLLLLAVNRFRIIQENSMRTARWMLQHPVAAIAISATVAGIVSCYPTVFLGKSFVSPNFRSGSMMLYPRFPTLPGYEETHAEDAHLADVSAMMWWSLPVSVIQHRAVFEQHELPLWNRYNSAGTVLLGQGQSAFGDPLHFLVMAAGGTSWAWDLKFVLARVMFAAGLGLVVWQATRHLPSALLIALSAPFIGFFIYRVNHPAYFSMCYAPWILFCWLRICSAVSTSGAIGWLLALVLANWTEMTSGTAKEAYMLLLSLNLTGAIVLVGAKLPLRLKLHRLVLALGAGALFAMLSAPIWVTFLDALSKSYTSYDARMAFQIHPAMLIGLFDEILYRPVQPGKAVWNPSANFFVLIGVLYAIVTFRRRSHLPFELPIILGTLLPAAIVYGAIPHQWITAVPFLGNVVHTDNTFSCVLIVHLFVVAGFGLHAAFQRLGGPEAKGDLIAAGVLLFALLVPYIALTHVRHRMWFDPNTFPPFLAGAPMHLGGLVRDNLISLLAASAVLAVVARRMLVHKATVATWIVAGLCFVVLHWRHGQHVETAYSEIVYNPTSRVDLYAPSSGIKWLQSQLREPSRVVGFQDTLFVGWSGVYDIEGISGPDPLFNPYYRELLDALGLERIWDWRIITWPRRIAELKPAYDFLNVRYFADFNSDPTRYAGVLQLVHKSDLDIYQSDTAWPRAFFTDHVATYDGVAQFAQLVRSGDGRPFAAMQTSDRPVGTPGDFASRTIVAATDYTLTANRTTFSVEAPGPGMIVLQEAFLPDDIRVEVNGRPAECVRVNHAFRGVIVDRGGSYRVSFRYLPERFTASVWASGFGLVGLVGLGAWGLFRSRVRRRTTETFA